MIDVLLATYNGQRFVSEQIESILSQTYCDWNLIIQDDCSSDETARILQSYQDRYPDKIKVFFNQYNSGSCINNFLSLAQKSSSQYVMFCDQDDVWLDDKMEVTLREMKRLEEKTQNKNMPLLIHTDLEVVDENLGLQSCSLFEYQKMDKYGDSVNHLLVQNIITGCTVMCNKNLISLVNLIGDDSKSVIMYDWWVGLIAATFGKIGFVDRPTVLYRQHSLNQVGAKKTRSLSYFVDKLFNIDLIFQRMKCTYYQAEKFLNIYRDFLDKLDKNDLKIIEEYVNMNSYGRLKKLCVLFKYDFFKYGFLRKIAQILQIIFF